MMRRILLVLMFLALSALPAFAQFDFPNSPTANEIIAGPAGQALKWDGTKWVAQFGSVGGPFLPEAPLDGNSYLRTNGAWTSGGTLANDLTVSAVHLTNLTGWAPLNFGQPSLTAGTDGAVVASLFAYNRGVGGNNNLNITAGAYMWNGNWVSATPTAEAIVMNPTSISLQYSTGNTVGAGLGTWNNIAVFNSTGLDILASPSPIILGPMPAPWGQIGAASGSTNFTAGAHAGAGGWIADSSGATMVNTNTNGYIDFYSATGLTAGAAIPAWTHVANVMAGPAGGFNILTGPLYFNWVPLQASNLSDYSTGTWTPWFAFDSCTTGITYAAGGQQGSYTKVGKLVHADFSVVLTNKGTCVGQAQIYPFPYNQNAVTNAFSGACIYSNVASMDGFVPISFYLSANANWGFFYTNDLHGGSSIVLRDVNITNATALQCGLTYTAQ